MRLHYRDAALRILWLSRGREPAGAASGEWGGMLEIARRERLLSLAWHRGGGAIRRLAPPGVSAQWRAEVLRDLDRGEAQLEGLQEILERFERGGIEAIVLKGAPLAQRLYGDTAARPSLDVDLYVPAEGRATARAELEALGWRQVGGGAPWEESFHRVSGNHQLLLEVHSWLLDDPVLLHLQLPAPDAAVVRLPALSCRAQDGDLLPGCLAAHLAKHDNAPLLWVNDFSMLWQSLDAARQAAARQSAKAHRLAGYLGWAVERAGLLERAAAGEAGALDEMGYGAHGRRESHSLLRLARLSAGPSDAAAVVMGRVWPPHLRGDGRGFVRQAAERAAGRARRSLTGATRGARPAPAIRDLPTSDPAGSRTLDVDREEFGSLLGDLMGAGVGTWIRARGESMEPTIPNGSLVRITPLPDRPLQAGEVVLARMPNGSFAVHRVVGERAGMVTMQGDAIARPDPDVRRDAVLGLADQVEIAGRVRPMPGVPSRLQRHLSGVVRRCVRRLPWLARARGAATMVTRPGAR